MNRQQVMTYVAVFGIIFLVFYWTNLAFEAGIKNAESSIKTVTQKIEKASALADQIRSGRQTGRAMNTGLLSFLQTSAAQAGLESRIGGIKPKNVPGAKEAATIRLENLNYSEVVSFLKIVEMYGNLYSANVSISKRFDNEKMMNLVMEIIKK